ncbi:hypothetical protein HGRIS_006145 [Hohenbuehelia grisea]|uniref:Uncharacterized protein n=1 Tax=Hohenbuehelia grisea TaxID=104357 RepID=A0ABR3JZ31_9AGAR
MTSRVWFITGTSSGFGRFVTELALEGGDSVVATLRNPELLNDLKSKHGEDRLLILKVDVRDKQHIENAFTRAVETFGHIDVVFNNAGYGGVSEAEGTPEELARDIFETNFWGAVHVSQAAIRTFRDVNNPPGGRLLQQSSLVGIGAMPLVAFYSAR